MFKSAHAKVDVIEERKLFKQRQRQRAYNAERRQVSEFQYLAKLEKEFEAKEREEMRKQWLAKQGESQ